MKKILEDELERRIRAGEIPRDVINDMLKKGQVNSPKQAWRTLEKWMAQERYEYGVSMDLGWMIPYSQ